MQKRADYVVKDPEIPGERSSVLHVYRHVLLFALSRPESLRRGESEKVYTALLDWAGKAILGPAPTHLPDYPVFVVDLTGYGGPTIPAYLRSGIGPSTRIIDVRQLLTVIRTRIQETDVQQDAVTLNQALAHSTLRRLETNLGLSAARNAKRAKREQDATVELGLKNIHHQVSHELELEEDDDQLSSNLTLQAIPPSERRIRGADSGNYITHPSYRNMIDEPEVWDVVGSGNVLTRAYKEELAKRANERYKVTPLNTHQEWKLADVSAGGFGLRWQGEGASKAHVGELVGLREVQRSNYAQWRIGVIRWMRFVGDDSFEAGVQALSPHGMAVMVDRRHAPREDTARECLILPEIKAVGQSTSLVTPAHMFKVGEIVKVRIFNKDMEVKLTNVVEHTGSFTQFQIVSTSLQSGSDQVEPDDESVPGSRTGQFDSIWHDI